MISVFSENEINDFIHAATYLEEESKRLEAEAQTLINKNIQIQIEARLLLDKHRYRRKYSSLLRQNRLNFSQLKHQIKHQRKSFVKFERRLQAQYEQPLDRIVCQTSPNFSESID